MTYRLKTMGLGSLPWQIKTHYFLTIYLPFSKNLLLCKPQQPNIFPLHYTYTIKNDCNSSIWIQVFWKRDGPAYSKRLSLGSVAERQQQNFLLFQSCLLHVQGSEFKPQFQEKHTEGEWEGQDKERKKTIICSHIWRDTSYFIIQTIPTLVDIHYANLMYVYICIYILF